MNSLNAIVRLSKDAELRFLSDGTPVAQLSMAMTSGYGDKAVTTWVNGSIFGKRAETLAPMLLKGQQVGVTGEITNRKYVAKDGTEKYSLEMRITDVKLLRKANVSDSKENASAPTTNASASDPFDDLSSDIPF